MSKRKRKEIRTDMRRVLSRLDERWIRAASAELSKNLCDILDNRISRPIRRVLAWTRFFPGEVDLSGFITQQLDQREIYLPRSLPDFSMTYLAIDDDWSKSIESGSLGIPEPSFTGGKVYDLQGCEDTVVVIPGLAFDRRGNRLGRGKGYYDRFLGRDTLRKALKIGVCWDLQLLEQVPTESHDVPVDWICHERGVIPTAIDYDSEFEDW